MNNLKRCIELRFNIKLKIKYLLFLFITISMLPLSSCKKLPEPEKGFSEPYYVKWNFMGEDVEIQANNIIIEYSEGYTGTYHVSTAFKGIRFEFIFDKSIKGGDISGLEDKDIPLSFGSAYPRVRVLTGDYCTGMKDINYGESNFLIKEVIKSKKVEYSHSSAAQRNPERRKGRSYVLRGECEFFISKCQWFASQDNPIFPIIKGKFSIPIILPNY